MYIQMIKFDSWEPYADTPRATENYRIYLVLVNFSKKY